MFLPMSGRDESDSFLELQTYEMGINQDSVRHRHYYQLTRVILDSEIGELVFYQGLREMNRISEMLSQSIIKEQVIP